MEIPLKEKNIKKGSFTYNPSLLQSQFLITTPQNPE